MGTSEDATDHGTTAASEERPRVRVRIAGVERVRETGTSQATEGPVPDPTLSPLVEVGPWTYAAVL